MGRRRDSQSSVGATDSGKSAGFNLTAGLPLFLQRAPYSEPTTSREAAERIIPHRERQWRLVLEALRSGPLTDQEIQLLTGISGDAERPRRGELVDARLVEDSGQVRTTKAGRDSKVWRLTEKGAAL